MKKILVCLIGIMFILPSFADNNNCGINKVVILGSQGRDDNEFLYENKTVYDEVSDENGTYSDLSGLVWECDNKYCPNRTVIQVPAGHYFRGVKQNIANWYKCRSDEWHPFACGENYISFDGNQKAADDEFLYENESAFVAANKASKAKQDGADLGGMVYECDNRHCMGRSTKKMLSGHYFKGQKVEHEVEYRCYTGVEDRWEPVGTVDKGETCGETHISFDGQGADDNEFLYSNETAYQAAIQAKQNRRDGAKDLGGLVYECDNDHCTDGVKVDMDPNHWFEGKQITEKRSYLCKAKFAGDDRWIVLTSMDDNVPGQEKPDNKNCRDNRRSPNGQACCDLSDNVAKYDKENDKCICIGNYEFAIENGRGVCNPKAGGDDDSAFSCPNGGSEKITSQKSCLDNSTFVCTDYVQNEILCKCGICIANNRELEKPYECEPAFLVKIDLWAKACKDETKYAEILALISRIKEYCSDDSRTEEGFLNLRHALEALNPEKCAMDTHNMISQATQKINAAVDSLRSYVSDLDVSKWKTADGKFNTARLASDSIAGVVLGTAGGLITSNVVKKHQVEDGFEDLQCVIGGQTVAGWGDEFTVGVH